MADHYPLLLTAHLLCAMTFGGAFLTDVAPELAAERLREACRDVEVPA